MNEVGLRHYNNLVASENRKAYEVDNRFFGEWVRNTRNSLARGSVIIALPSVAKSRLLLVRHECTLYIGVRNCTRDEGRPLGAGLQEQVSNYLKLRW